MALEETVDVGQSGHSQGVVQVNSWHSEMTHMLSILSDRVQAQSGLRGVGHWLKLPDPGANSVQGCVACDLRVLCRMH